MKNRLVGHIAHFDVLGWKALRHPLACPHDPVDCPIHRYLVEGHHPGGHGLYGFYTDRNAIIRLVAIDRWDDPVPVSHDDMENVLALFGRQTGIPRLDGIWAPPVPDGLQSLTDLL